MKSRTIDALPRQSVAVLAVMAMGIAAGMMALSAPEPKMIFAAILGCIAMLAAIVRIDWGLAILAFLTYAGVSDALSMTYGAPPVLWPLIGALLLAGVLHWIISGEHTSGWAKGALCIALYFAVCAVSLIWTADPDRTVKMLYELTQGVVIAAAVLLLLQDASGARKAVWGLIAAGVLVGTINAYQYLTGTFGNVYWGFARAEIRQITIGLSDYRITGPVGDANFFAQIMLMIVPIAAERAWNEKRILFKAFAAWSFAVSLACVIFTFSRGAFLAMVFVAGLALLRKRPKIRYWILLLLASVIIISFLPKHYTERMRTLVEVLPLVEGEGIKDPAIKGRASGFAAGMLMFAEHPLVGVGYGNFPRFYQQYSRKMGVDPHLSDRSAHSMYIEILTEGGLLGMGSFALLIGLLLARLWKTRRLLDLAGNRQARSMLAAFEYGLIAYLVAAMFLHSAYPRYMWLLIGIGLALPKAILVEKEAAAESENTAAGTAAGSATC